MADIKRKFIVDDWSYLSLVDAIPRDWKTILKSQTDSRISRAATLEENIDYTLNIEGRTLKTDKLTNKLIYNSLKVSKKLTAEKKGKQFIGDNDLTLVCSMPFKITKNTKLQYF